MNNVSVFGKEFEMDFIAGWIKYLRMQKGYSQEYLSKGICSKSHLSYFENGKKGLKGDVIELLLGKLEVKASDITMSVGRIRKKFLDMAFAIEFSNYDDAAIIYQEFIDLEEMMTYSPYHIEYRIYILFYLFFVEKVNFDDYKEEFDAIDKIYHSLGDELQHYYLFLSGRAYYKYRDHKEGIRRLHESLLLKENPYVNYLLGFSYSFDDQPIRGIFYLEKALDSYTKNGRYISALWCHNNLGICYAHLGLYDDAKKSYMAALNGAEYFEDKKILDHLHINIADLNLKSKKYEESLKWTQKSLDSEFYSVLAAVYLIEAYLGLGDYEAMKPVFEKFLVEENIESKYYQLLRYYDYLVHKDEREDFEAVVTQEILPYYKKLNYINLCDPIREGLISYYESKRRYKDANKLYKELLRI